MTIYNGTKRYLNGLPEKAPYFITVDGIKDIPKNMEGELFLMENQENRNKYDEYIRQLQMHFKDHDNVKILIAGKNIGLANNIRRVIDHKVHVFVSARSSFGQRNQSYGYSCDGRSQ